MVFVCRLHPPLCGSLVFCGYSHTMPHTLTWRTFFPPKYLVFATCFIIHISWYYVIALRNKRKFVTQLVYANSFTGAFRVTQVKIYRENFKGTTALIIILMTDIVIIDDNNKKREYYTNTNFIWKRRLVFIVYYYFYILFSIAVLHNFFSISTSFCNSQIICDIPFSH